MVMTILICGARQQDKAVLSCSWPISWLLSCAKPQYVRTSKVNLDLHTVPKSILTSTEAPRTFPYNPTARRRRYQPQWRGRCLSWEVEKGAGIGVSSPSCSKPEWTSSGWGQTVRMLERGRVFESRMTSNPYNHVLQLTRVSSRRKLGI